MPIGMASIVSDNPHGGTPTNNRETRDEIAGTWSPLGGLWRNGGGGCFVLSLMPLSPPNETDQAGLSTDVEDMHQEANCCPAKHQPR
jgi:hypothetical protein